MKTIIFDTGPIISLAMNNLLWILKPLSKDFDGEFIITSSVKKEGIERPIQTKKFKFQAMQVLKIYKEGIIKMAESKKINTYSKELLETANSIFSAKGKNIQIVHEGEMQAVAASILLGSEAIVIDERTTRILIESPRNLQTMLSKKNKANIEINEEKLKLWQDTIKNIKVIRSTELATIAFEKGYLNEFVPDIRNGKEELLEGILWGLRLNGCSISNIEIAKLHKIERRLGNS